MVVLIILLVLGVAALRSYNMWGLDDAPEPFDIAAFQAERIPDDQNAYAIFKRAYEMLDKKPPSFTNLQMKMREAEWVDINAEARDWIDRNLPALEVWRTGTDLPFLQSPKGLLDFSEDPAVSWNSRTLWSQMALLQASRLEDAGDFSGAWKWHKARLRGWLQTGYRQPLINLFSTSFRFSQLSTRSQSWADHKGVTVAQIRTAMADLEAMDGLTGKPSDTLKAQYLFMEQSFQNYWQYIPPSDPNSVKVVLDPVRPAIQWVKYLVTNEPERSKRTLRLMFANWLAEADKPMAERSKEFSKVPLIFLPEPGKTPPISPQTLAWHAENGPLIFAMRDGYLPMRANVWGVENWPRQVEASRRSLAGMRVGMASRIYEIETGKWPSSPDELIGKVIPKLPENYVEAGSDQAGNQAGAPAGKANAKTPRAK